MTTKVLITVPRLDLPGGVANYYRILWRHLGPEKKFFEIGVRRRESNMIARISRIARDYWHFRNELKTGDFSVVHLNPSLAKNSLVRDAVYLLIARFQNVPVVIFFRGWDNDLRNYITRWLPGLFRFLLNKASEIIVLGTDFRKQLLEAGVNVPIEVMTTLVDDTVFETLHPDNSDRSGITVLFLSRLAKGKGLIEAIQSFALLRERVPECKLLVAGSGPERHSAERLVERNLIAGVTFTGQVDGDAKRQVFLESDIFFFPTFYSEGMPNAVLEAMAYGLPVVTRPVGGLVDFFEDGLMGFMSTSDDPSIFAEILEHMALDADLRRRMGEYNREYAKKHFAASKIAEELELIYKRNMR